MNLVDIFAPSRNQVLFSPLQRSLQLSLLLLEIVHLHPHTPKALFFLCSFAFVTLLFLLPRFRFGLVSSTPSARRTS